MRPTAPAGALAQFSTRITPSGSGSEAMHEARCCRLSWTTGLSIDEQGAPELLTLPTDRAAATEQQDYRGGQPWRLWINWMPRLPPPALKDLSQGRGSDRLLYDGTGRLGAGHWLSRPVRPGGGDDRLGVIRPTAFRGEIEGADRALGLFVNTQALRVDLSWRSRGRGAQGLIR